MTDDEINTSLSYLDYNTCAMAIRKCLLLWRAAKVGLPVNINKDNFGFPDMTYEEEEDLVKRIYANSDLAWLKEQREKVKKDDGTEDSPKTV